MNVTGIDIRFTPSTFALSGILPIGTSANVSGAYGSPAAVSDGAGSQPVSSAASVDISSPAQLFAKLQTLQQEDPEKFKAVVGDIAKKLQTAAGQQAQGQGGQFLSNLAQKFQDVANGANISELNPAAQGHHGGHHHHKSGVQNAYAQNGTSTSPAAGASSNNPIRQVLASVTDEISQATANL